MIIKRSLIDHKNDHKTSQNRLREFFETQIPESILVNFLIFGFWYNKRSIYRNFLTIKCLKTPKSPN